MKNKIIPVLGALLFAFSAFSCSSQPSGQEKDPVDQSGETPEVTTAETSGAEETEEEYIEPDYPELTADENSITFDDGDLYTAHCMNEKNFENDESDCRLSVADFKGTKQLKIEILDFDEEKGKYKTPKIVFDMDRLVGSDNLSKVKSFSCDITQVAVGDFKGNDGVLLHVPGNLMGTFGSNVGEDCSEWYVPTGSASEYATAEWQCSWEYIHVEGKWLLKGFTDGTKDSTLVFMRWSIPNQADVYLDNITFYDEDGNSIPLVYKPGQPEEEETEENGDSESVTEAPTEETAESGETTEVSDSGQDTE